MAETVLERHPKLRATFAHLYFCGDDRAHLERLLDRYENVRVDITPGVEMYDHFFADREGWRDFFVRRQDRIQLGTDTDRGDAFSGETPLALARGALSGGAVDQWGHRGQGLDLPQAVVQKIVRENFLAFAGAHPKPVAAD